MCLSEGENFIVSRGSQFTDGTRCESDTPAPFGTTAACLRGRCQVLTLPRSHSALLSPLVMTHTSFCFPPRCPCPCPHSCLAVMECCILGTHTTFAGCARETARPAASPQARTAGVKPEVAFLFSKPPSTD